MNIRKGGYVGLIWHKHGTAEKKVFVLISAFCLFIYFYYTLITTRAQNGDLPDLTYYQENQKYLINTSNCRIPNADPYGDEVRKYIRKERYMNCTDLGLLTYIHKEDDVATLKINSSLLPLYSSFGVTCCYSKIYRYNYLNRSDSEVWYSQCIEFEDEIVITYPFIRVECKALFYTIYANVHATVLPTKPQGSSRIDTKNRYSVLMVAIDSISKFNLIRTMPKTYSYLENHFHDLRGYNKIGDNTFPNLMAILTGENDDQLDISCRKELKINDCSLIWDTFKSLGYTTAYAEDECEIATFNFDRPGFREPPTDYYYRPYFSAADKLPKVMRHGMSFCTGPETSGERVLNAAKDFSISLKHVPSFGLFWMNSFSHEDINMPSAMDDKVLEFLSDASFKSSLEDTVVLFFSDHGFRFGDIRYTHTGWLEERLPYMYVYLPDKFKRNHREKFDSVTLNTERLVTPYDVYCTLQEILGLGNSSYKAKMSRGCPQCQSLFTRISENRTCKDVAIDQHWCTCTGHKKVSTRDSLVVQVATYVVMRINKLTKSFPEGKKCAIYTLSDVVTAGMSEDYVNEKNQTVRYFLVIVRTQPSAMFEATVEARQGWNISDFKLLGDISRVSRYKGSSDCVENAVLKKYCYCDGFLGLIKSAICLNFDC